MIHIEESSSSQGFVCDVYFERTNAIKDRVVDCSREELIDLVFHYLKEMEKIQIISEHFNSQLERTLGYYEPMKG